MILFGVLFYLSEYLEQQYGLDGVQKGLVLAVPVLFMSATSFITGFVIKKAKRNMQLLVITGLIIMTAALAFLPLSKGAIIYFAAVSVVGIGTGLVLPCLNTLITSAATSKERGLVTSLYGSVRFFGVALGPPLYGYLMARGTGLMFWGSAGLSLAAAAVFYILAGVHSGVKKKPGTFIFRPVPAKKPNDK
jgi:ACDE family multidrug resistance protein